MKLSLAVSLLLPATIGCFSIQRKLLHLMQAPAQLLLSLSNQKEDEIIPFFLQREEFGPPDEEFHTAIIGDEEYQTKEETFDQVPPPYAPTEEITIMEDRMENMKEVAEQLKLSVRDAMVRHDIVSLESHDVSFHPISTTHP